MVWSHHPPSDKPMTGQRGPSGAKYHLFKSLNLNLMRDWWVAHGRRMIPRRVDVECWYSRSPRVYWDSIEKLISYYAIVLSTGSLLLELSACSILANQAALQRQAPIYKNEWSYQASVAVTQSYHLHHLCLLEPRGLSSLLYVIPDSRPWSTPTMSTNG